MILRFILIALGLYIVYKVIFSLVIPIFRTTQKIRRQFGDMHQQMQDQMNATQNGHAGTQPQSAGPEPKKTRTGDYIDFEEVK
ncbi:MAG: DUF4834 family protein [Chitinophagaceae bacterium]